MTTSDWFVGSASKRLTGITEQQTHWVHAIGVRGDEQLFVLVTGDIADIAQIDCSSLQFHIHQHPLARVDVVLVPSGHNDALHLVDVDADQRHRIIHAITDCVVDALTFGCPAVMRWSAYGIQWRKFDDTPIGTLLLQAADTPADAQRLHLLNASYGDPVVLTCQAGTQAALPVGAQHDVFAGSSAVPLRQVSWQRHLSHWVVTFNEHRLCVVAGRSLEPLPAHVISTQPTQLLSDADRAWIREVNGDTAV